MLILFLSLMGLVFITCEKKRYPEDEHQSLFSSYKRIRGNWTIQKLLYNGVDVTEAFNDSIYPYKTCELNFEFKKWVKVYDGKKPRMLSVSANGSILVNLEYAIEISQRNLIGIGESSYFQETTNPSVEKQLKNSFSGFYDIMKLYKDELHIKPESSKYEIYFKKK
ncbi:MAG: hypothetical protein IPM51_17280 [Sphingobacteriaceae bacterium]|nr:hypothetical protein [Sphingobacteriaceae bacterium]